MASFRGCRGAVKDREQGAQADMRRSACGEHKDEPAACCIQPGQATHPAMPGRGRVHSTACCRKQLQRHSPPALNSAAPAHPHHRRLQARSLRLALAGAQRLARHLWGARRLAGGGRRAAQRGLGSRLRHHGGGGGGGQAAGPHGDAHQASGEGRGILGGGESHSEVWAPGRQLQLLIHHHLQVKIQTGRGGWLWGGEGSGRGWVWRTPARAEFKRQLPRALQLGIGAVPQTPPGGYLLHWHWRMAA